MKILKYFAYFLKIVYEPLILISIHAHEYYFYEGKDQVLYEVLCYIQTGFVLIISLFMQRAICRLAFLGFYNLQIKINLNKRLLECCDTNNIGKNVQYDSVFCYKKHKSEWIEQKFGLHILHIEKEAEKEYKKYKLKTEK